MKKKVIASSVIAFLLLATISLCLFSNSKKVKADGVYYGTANTNTLLTINGMVNSLSVYSTLAVDTPYFLQNESDGYPFVFQPSYYFNGSSNLSDSYDDNNPMYFALSIRKRLNGNTPYYLLCMHSLTLNSTYNYWTINQGIYYVDTFDNFYDQYYLNPYLSLDDDIDRNISIFAMLYNKGFYCLVNFPLNYNMSVGSYAFTTDINDYDNLDTLTRYAMGPGSYQLLSQIQSYEGAYSNGFQLGIETGENNVLSYPNGYGLYSQSEYEAYGQQQYILGANSSTNGFNEFTNILTTAWNATASLLNTEILGRLKVIHCIALPLLLGLFLIILKLIRG